VQIILSALGKRKTETEAIGTDRGAKVLRVKGPSGGSQLAYDALILAQGGSPIIPEIRGVDAPNVFTLWTLADMDRLDSYPWRTKISSLPFIAPLAC
jgi:NAD(P)H-nitrite reductase large subunit